MIHNKSQNEGIPEELAPAADKAGESLKFSARFFHDIVGLKTDRLLPYASQLVMLSIYIQSLPETFEEKLRNDEAALVRWFWRTSFNGWFAGANTTDLRKASEKMTDLAASSDTETTFENFFDDRPLRDLPRAFDRRNARIRSSLIVQILSQSLRGPIDGSEFDGFEVFDGESSRDIPYFFPNIPAPLISSPANRVILPSGYSRNAQQYFLALDTNSREEILRSHLINEDAFSALQKSDADSFLKLRETEIRRVENEFLSRYGLPLVATDGIPDDNETEIVSDSDA